MRKSKQGGTSVFLMMAIVSVLLVIAMLTETVSSAAARSYATAIIELAGRSTLSNYDLSLKEDYGLFGMMLHETQIENEVLYYCNQTLHSNPKSNDTMRLINLKLKNVKIDCDEYSLTNCDIFEKQIVDYMKYRAVGDILIDWTEKNAEKALEQKQEEVNDLMEGAQELKNTTQLMQKIKPILSQYEDVLDKTKKLEPRFKRWQELKDSESENAAKQASKLKKYLYREWTRLKKSYQSVNRQINEVNSFYGDGNSFGESGKNMMKQVESIQKEIKFFLSVSVENLDLVFMKLKEQRGKKKRNDLNRKIQSYSKFEQEDNESNRILKNKAVINYLPSQQMKQNWSFAGFEFTNNQKNFLLEIKNQFLLNQYIFHKFPTQLTEERDKETFFQNEVEYLLFGEFKDSKNKRKAEHSIFALRSASNLVYLFCDAEKQKELATVAATMTPGPEAIITQCVLATLWSCAEAQNDLKILLDGGTVPFLKSDDSWILSLDAVLTGKNSKTEEKNPPDGLRYDQYLNLFLFCAKKQTVLIRMMDLIQVNLQGRYDREFLLCNCKGGFQFKGEVWKKSILGEPKEMGIIRKGKVVMSHAY